MNAQRNIETNEDMMRALFEFFQEDDPETLEAANAALREAGYDPDAIGARMHTAAERTLAESPFNWRNRAPRELEDERTRMRQSSAAVPGNRAAMIGAIEKLAAQLGRQLTYAYRNLDSVTDEDLADLLADLEYLASRQHTEQE